MAEDFVVSKCNESAIEFVKNYNPQNETLPKIFAVVAPKLSGKTYLANIWRQNFDAEFLNLGELGNINLVKFIRAKKFYIIEDIDEIKNQELLLQIFNLIQEKLAFLMITSTNNLWQAGLRITDLNSRLKNVFCLEINKPDDDIIKMLLIKNFSTKQLKVASKVVDFLSQNLPRDFSKVFDAVRLLEFYSLEKKRHITIPLVKEVIKF